MSRRVLGPFNRVEGDVEVRLDVADGRVAEAQVCSPLYRGFEQILEGRDPMDALVIAPRVCGICSVSQSVAAAHALADAAGVRPLPEGARIRDLVHACENLADHLTHFYLFFMPDFADAGYAGHGWYDGIAERFRAIKGTASGDFLPARTRLLQIMGILAGKWPHSLALQPGGVTKGIDAGGKMRLQAVLRETRRFMERHTYGDNLEAVAAIETADGLAAWSEGAGGASDFGRFLAVSRDLGLGALGCFSGPFLSYGAFPGDGGKALFPAGLFDGRQVGPVDLTSIAEDTAFAWMDGGALHPAEGINRIAADKPDAYSWCKAPRLGGRPVEVGALARQLVAGHPLARDLAARGSNVQARVVMRLIEAARLLLSMEAWAASLNPGAAVCIEAPIGERARGVGLTEAARGALGHWLTVADGHIAGYQIIAPTTWNFSPRAADGRPGPLEQALVGCPAPDDQSMPVAVRHVVRSFDPCMVCTVH